MTVLLCYVNNSWFVVLRDLSWCILFPNTIARVGHGRNIVSIVPLMRNNNNNNNNIYIYIYIYIYTYIDLYI